MTKYLFESQRLGFKNLTNDVIDETIRMNSDSDVMKYFPTVMSPEESMAYINSAIQQQDDYGYSKYAVYVKNSDTFIGIIGLFQVNFESDIFGEVEIGWRLLKEYWHNGYATEGAERVIEYGFNDLDLSVIYSFTAIENKPSAQVMERIGMTYIGTFNHPKVDKGHQLEQHVLYEIHR
jgi:RimJ/RimL family protein N-acetyltransferase